MDAIEQGQRLAQDADSSILEALRESESTAAELCQATGLGEMRVRRSLKRLMAAGEVAKGGQSFSRATTQFAEGGQGIHDYGPPARSPGELISFEPRISQQLAKVLANLKKAVSYFDPDLVDKLDKRMADEHDPAEHQLQEWSHQLNRLGQMYFQAVREKQDRLAELQQETIETGQYAEQLKKQVLKYKAEWESFAKQAEEWGQDLLDAVDLLKSLNTAQFKERFIRFNALRQPRIIEAANEIIKHLDEATKKEVRWNLLGNSKLKFW